jgi:hypothetical protein
MHRELKAEAARPPAAKGFLEQKKLNVKVGENFPVLVGLAFPVILSTIRSRSCQRQERRRP